MEVLHEDYIAAGIRNQTAQEQQEFNLIAQLKPSIGRDGSQWRVLYGDEIGGIAGFGNSPYLAIMDFNAQWYKEIPTGKVEEVTEMFPGTMSNLKDITACS